MPTIGDPLRIGRRCALKHRIVMAPMTRLRADDDHVPQDMVFDYYSQRATVPGTLLITESAFISQYARGRDENAPGIYSEAQIEAWRRITDEVHSKGSFIFMQLWHVGRAARQRALDKAGLESLSSSDIPISSDFPKPRPMTEEEIVQCIEYFSQAAMNAMRAGFDGVEIHGANGYLIDQFTQDVSNRRTDRWGGSVENRSRFCLEVTKAVVKAIGADRTAVRLSPFSDFQGMRMADPVPQFTHLAENLRSLNLAYLHLIEPRVSGITDRDAGAADALDFIVDVWKEASPIVFAGGYTTDKAEEALRVGLNGGSAAFAFGRHFISNPDLPYRLLHDQPLTPYDRNTFYSVKDARGYTNYTVCNAWNDHLGTKM